jgi:3-oxoacyl-[acyl-carrier protein] reductase
VDLGIHDRVALVCAASRGLGKAAAIGFAREGAHVVLCARNRKRLREAAKEISGAAVEGVRVIPLVADLTKPQQIRTLVKRVLKEFGRIDILVTNAGGPPVASFADLDDDLWRQGVDLTFLSTVRCIREVLPHMQKRRWGRIINITSIAAKQPIADLVVSSALRPGILGLSRVLATQYAQEGILINSVAPGYFLTDRQKEIGTARAAQKGVSLEEYLTQAAVDIPVRRLGTPEELADVIVFLGSERASYLNGTTISVDGGLMKGLF